MPVKEWFRDLGEFRILHSRETVNGEVISFKVVLIAFIEDDWVCVTRYDCADGFPHQDLVGRKSGLREKVVYPNVTKRELFRHAILDLYENHEFYRQDYLTH